MTRNPPPLALAVLVFAVLATGCVGFNRPEGWAGPTLADDLLVASTDKGELSALDPNPESDAQCRNADDDDEDGWVNEGCPQVGGQAERGSACANASSDDAVNGIADDDEVNDGCPAVVPLWTFPTGQEEPEIDLEAIYTTALVIDGTVYLGGFNGEAYALDLETGEPAWARPFDADGSIIAGLAAGESTIYAATDDGALFALDASDGSQQQRFSAGDSIWAAPLLADGNLYVASVNGKLYRLDAGTLETLWDEPFDAGRGLISDPVLADGTILVGGIGRTLHAVDADSGEEREGWPFKADNWFWGRPLVADGIVYAPNLDGRLYALSLETGDVSWSFEAEDPLRSAPVLAGDALVIADRGGNVYGIDPDSGTLNWSAPAILDKRILANPLVLNDRVVISAEGGDLFTIDPTAGSFVKVVTP